MRDARNRVHTGLARMQGKNQTSTSRFKSSSIWTVLLLIVAIIAAQYLSVLAAVVSCSVLLVSALLMRRISDPFDFRKLNVISFWYLSYLAIVFLPSFFVYADHEGPYRLAYLVSVQSVLVTFPLGIVVTRGARRSTLNTAERYFESSLEEFHLPSSLVEIYAVRSLPSS